MTSTLNFIAGPQAGELKKKQKKDPPERYLVLCPCF
jgi:hypothetical protein